MDNFVARTEDISEFGARLSVVADTIDRARSDAARGDHTALNTVLGLIAEDFVRVTGEAQQSHIDDIDRLAAAVSGLASATHNAHDIYVGTDDFVRRNITESARS